MDFQPTIHPEIFIHRAIYLQHHPGKYGSKKPEAMHVSSCVSQLLTTRMYSLLITAIKHLLILTLQTLLIADMVKPFFVFKLRLGASIPWLVCRSVGRSSTQNWQ